MNRSWAHVGASTLLCCVMSLSGPIASHALTSPQTFREQLKPAVEAARSAQSTALQIAEKARDIGKKADELAVSARKAAACGPAAKSSGLVAVCAEDCARYYGEMKNGRFDGLGVYVFANGYMIKG